MARSEADWERIAASTGILSVVTGAVGTFIVGTPPAADASIQEIRAYFVDHRMGLLVQCFLLGLSAVALIWFAGALRSYLRRHEGATGRLSATAFGGAIAIALMLLVSVMLEVGLVYRVAPTADDVLVRALFDALTVGGALFGFPVAVFLAAASLVGLRNGGMSRGVAYLGMVGVVANVAGGTEIFFKSGPWVPGGSATFIPFGVLVVWEIAVAGTMMSRRTVQIAG